MKTEIRPVEQLQPHPALKFFPMLPTDELALLAEDIRDNNLREPLDVVGDLVIDGRNRLEALKACGLTQCSVIVREAGTDPIEFALAKSILRRNLTKSAIALLLFCQHPDLESERGKRKTEGLKQGKTPMFPRGHSMASYRSVAEKYHVHRDYFRLLAEHREAVNDEDWAADCAKIYAGLLHCTTLMPARGGRDATKGKKRADPQYDILAPQVVVTLNNVFKNWTGIKWTKGVDSHGQPFDTHHKTLLALKKSFEQMPDEVRRLNHDIILDWPEHEREQLAKDLKRVAAESRK